MFLLNIFFVNYKLKIIFFRNFEESILLIDRAEVNITQQLQSNVTQQLTESSNKVFIGGINSTDPRFAIYKSYSGCLSSKLLQPCHQESSFNFLNLN